MRTKNKNQIPAPTRKKEFESIKALYESGKLIKATSEAIKYIEKYPSDVYGHFLCGKLLYKCKRYEEAQKEFKFVYKADGKNKYSGLVYLGQTEEMLGDTESACMHYKEAIENSPYFEKHAIVNLANIERKNGNYQNIIDMIDKYAQDTEEISILLEKVQALTLLDRIDESSEILNEIDPEDNMGIREVYLEKSNIAKIKENYELSKYYLLLAKDSGTKNSLYYVSLFELAKINIKMENFEEAISCCEELVEAGHLFENDVYIALGTAQQKLKQYNKAMQSFRKALSIENKSYTTATYYLATLEYVSGNEELAEKYLKESIRTEQTFSLSKAAKLLNLLIRQERFEEADQILADIIQNDASMVKEKEIYLAELLIAVGLNKEIPVQRQNSYIAEQIMNHNEGYTLEHIKRSHSTASRDKSFFAKDIDIETLYEEAKIYLTQEHLVSKGVLDDYEIDYPNIGISNDELVNRLTIMTLPGTKKIITMHPSHHDDMPRKIDIIKDKQNDESKGNDRISKFYKKYGTTNLYSSRPTN